MAIMLFVVLVGVVAVAFVLVKNSSDEKRNVDCSGSMWQKMFLRVRDVPERYPLAVVATISLCVIGFIIIESDEHWKIEQYTRIIMTLVTLFLVSISAEMWVSAKKEKLSLRLLVQLGVVIFVLIYSSLLPEDFDQLPFCFAIAHVMWYACFMALLFVAPYIGHKTKNVDVYGNWVLLIGAIVIGLLFSVTAFALGSLLIMSLDTLFDVTFDRSFEYWWTVCATLVGPIVALAYLPRDSKHALRKSLPKVLQIFVQYVVMPFVIIYFVVLYAYTGKIIFLWEWPDGMVSWMIIAFSIIGWSVYVVIFPWMKSNRFFMIFEKFFPWVALLQIGMLFIALWWRINAYGITVNRYFVALFGVWLLVNALYFGLARNKKLIVLLYAFIFLTFFASFGTWGVFDVAKKSQTVRLQNTLIEQELLNANGSVNKAKKDTVSQEMQNNIVSMIKYIRDVHGDDALIQALPQVVADAQKAKRCKNDCADRLEEEFGIKYIYNYKNQKESYVNYRYKNTNEYSDTVGFEVEGYSYIIPDDHIFFRREKAFDFSIDSIVYNIQRSDDSIDIVKEDKKHIMTIDLLKILKEASNFSGESQFIKNYTQNGLDVKFIITDIDGSIDDEKEEIYSFSGAMLLRHVQ